MLYALTLFLWFAFWSAQAGRSIASIDESLDDWQDKVDWYSNIPEWIVGATFASVSIWAIDKFADVSVLWLAAIWLFLTFISRVGKNAATWAYLRWEGDPNPNTERSSTLKPINDWIAGQLGYKLGDEGYSWVWASTKGFITTLPVLGLGLFFQPLCREIASHAKKVGLPFSYNFWMEALGDGLAYAASCILFILLILQLGA